MLRRPESVDEILKDRETFIDPQRERSADQFEIGGRR
jgi:hypothetical protein